ncbi:NADH dehydrogenase [ubiquinone] 1 alpha subcomplex subunit 7 [Drosophila eugracilis]|uniref:NADH dehydrogenase [ubiquinone] 1 alpha subcomplex subunit 7 n=1 Tax=Drosophila eugracilis TaxID=29029 RepID=UPI0007E5D036|nr:NADH dehydrogenase [ubiquinone] 1 alpha subcomplex subunit 7 [Drosophila eugracilis]
MPPKPKHRDVAGFLSKVRNFFLGRTHRTAHRFADTIAPRTQPPPAIPQGPSEGLSANYYYTRDPRRLVKPFVDVVQEYKQMLMSKAKAEEAAKNAKANSGDASKDGTPPPPPPKSEDAERKECKEEEDAKVKKLPTPGKVHSWEGPH